MSKDGEAVLTSTDKMEYDAYNEKVQEEAAIIAKRIVSAAFARLTDEIDVVAARNPSPHGTRVALRVLHEAAGRISDELNEEVRLASRKEDV